MARPSNWNSPTKSVRLPEHAIDACIKLARQLDGLDEPPANVQNPEGLTLYKPASDIETIRQGITEGWITPGEPDLAGPETTPGPYIVGIGQTRYLVQCPPGLDLNQWAKVAKAEAELWGQLAKLTDNERWYVFAKLVEAWGQAGRLPDAA